MAHLESLIEDERINAIGLKETFKVKLAESKTQLEAHRQEKDVLEDKLAILSNDNNILRTDMNKIE